MTEQVKQSGARLGRRAVLYTAAHAAWAVPAIQFATAVDANAATCSAATTAPTDASFVSSTVSQSRVAIGIIGVSLTGWRWTATGNHTVTNSGSQGTATMTITLAGSGTSNVQAPTVASGWTTPSKVGSTNSWTTSRVIPACAVSVDASFSLRYDVSSLLGVDTNSRPVTVTVTP